MTEQKKKQEFNCIIDVLTVFPRDNPETDNFYHFPVDSRPRSSIFSTYSRSHQRNQPKRAYLEGFICRIHSISAFPGRFIYFEYLIQCLSVSNTIITFDSYCQILYADLCGCWFVCGLFWYVCPSQTSVKLFSSSVTLTAVTLGQKLKYQTVTLSDRHCITDTSLNWRAVSLTLLPGRELAPGQGLIVYVMELSNALSFPNNQYESDNFFLPGISVVKLPVFRRFEWQLVRTSLLWDRV